MNESIHPLPYSILKKRRVYRVIVEDLHMHERKLSIKAPTRTVAIQEAMKLLKLENPKTVKFYDIKSVNFLRNRKIGREVL